MNQQSKLRAIETPYQGYRFRSRLEARWAFFMDQLQVRWQYEPEGFDLDGLWYLPDFWLPEQQVWIEVKPEYPNDIERLKACRLAVASGFPVVVFDTTEFEPYGFRSVKDLSDLETSLTGAWGHTFLPDGKDTEGFAWPAWEECTQCEKEHHAPVFFPAIMLPAVDEHELRVHAKRDPSVWSALTPKLTAAYAATRAERFDRT